MRRRRGRKSGLQLTAEINVTSLVDVAFTLLVIFIITAPILQGGVDVAVPKADVSPLDVREEPLFVSVTRDGTVFVDETPIGDGDDLEAILGQMVRARGAGNVVILGDSLAAYGGVLRAIVTVARSEGITFSLGAEPYRPR